MMIKDERIELSCHTKMSEMYGINEIEEYIDEAIKRGYKGLGITDIESIQSFIKAQRYLEKKEIKDFKIIYGVQVKFAYDEVMNEQGESEVFDISIYVKEQKGLKNLYTLISKAYTNTSDKSRVIFKSQLDKYREGLIYGSSGEKGEVYSKLYINKSSEEIKNIAKYYDFMQIVPSKLEKDININKQICKIGDELGILVFASSVPKFINKEDSICSEILNHHNNITPIEKDNNKYLYTTQEMLEEFEYLGKEKARQVVVENTQKLVSNIQEVIPMTTKKCYPKIENADTIIRKETYKKAEEIYGEDLPKDVEDRIKLELDSIIANNFENIYVLASEVAKLSKQKGYIVGSRGSVGNSFVAFLLGITGYNPLKYDLPFEAFAGKDLDKEPDIDLNVSPEIKEDIEKYLEEKFGENKVFYAGTVGSIAEKTALEMIEKFSKALETTILEKEKIKDKLVGIKRTTGLHPGGVMILDKEDEIVDFTPIEVQDGKRKTHFDYHELWENLYKFDLLSHDTPTFLHKLEEKSGIDSNSINLEDEEVIKIFSNEGKISTRGIPDFGTEFTINLLKKIKPKNINEIVCTDCLAHGSGTWEYNAEYLVQDGTAGVSEVISNRADIMNYLISKGLDRKISYDITKFIRMGKSNRASRIRSGRDEEISAQWEEYTKIMEEHGVPEWYIRACRKIQYLFPKSHAIEYTLQALKIAWYKIYYPEAFYKTYFEINDEIDIQKYRDKSAVKREIRYIEEKLEENSKWDLTLKYSKKLDSLKLLLEMLELGIDNGYIKQDDVYELINSRAIGDYCREIKHKFNTEEIAVLIFRNKRMSIDEKIAKYKELINDYPDMEVIERINCSHYDSVKEMIEDEIDRLESLYSKLKNYDENSIYTCTEYNKSTQKNDYYNDFRNTRKTFKEVYKIMTDYIEEYDDTLAFDIKRRDLTEERDEIAGEYVVINKKPILVNIRDFRNNDLDIENIFLNIPTPFKKGDILVEWNDVPCAEGCIPNIRSIFVLDWLCTWRDGLEDLLKRGNHDSSDMCATGYYMYDYDSDEFVCDHKFDYDNFEYFDGEFEGITRVLKAISSLKKEKIDVELFTHSYEEMRRENFKSHLSWYTDEGLKLAGFSEKDIKELKS